MKKGYYLQSESRISPGVSKKIDMQISELSKYYEMREIEIKPIPRSLLKRVIGLFPTASILRDYEDVLNTLDDPAFVYIRRFTADRRYILFLKKIKDKYPKCKILVEIFTYPYDKDDFAKWNAWPFYIKEKLYRGQQKKYVDRFITYTKDENIFEVPTIKSINGIDVSAVKKVGGEFSKEHIGLIGVAYMQRHHGYERVISGLGQYYTDNKNPSTIVTLDLVGDGPEKEYYRELVKNYNIEEYVHFYPSTTGDDLDAIYDKNDIALSSLGLYKLGLAGTSVLKTREYMAKGMLMLLGSVLDEIDDNYKYAISYPNDSSTINIDRLVEFYHSIYDECPSKSELSNIIRNFAFKNVDISVAMKPIIDYIEG